MDVRNAIELLGWYFLMPACISGALRVLLSRCMPSRLAAGCGLAAAVLAGFAVLNDNGVGAGRLLATRHWHWLAYLPAIALVPFGLATVEKVRPGNRFLAVVLVSVVAAVLLVPDWARLDDLRLVYRVGFCASAVLGYVVIDFTAGRVHPGWLLGLLGASLLAMAPLLAVFLSVAFATMMTVAAGAVLGLAASCIRRADADALRPTSRLTAPVAVLMLFAGCFIGFVDSDPPLYGFLIAGLLPGVPVLFALRLGRSESAMGRMGEVVCAIAVLGGAATILQLETRTQPVQVEPSEAIPVGPATEDEWFRQLDDIGNKPEGRAEPLPGQ